MKNLEEMKEQLLDCAKEEAKEMVAQTKKEIEERKKMEEERIDCKLCSLRRKEEQALNDSYLNYQEQLKKQGELYVLREKQKQIEELITKAYQEILKWQEENYFSFLESLITARMRAGEGILYFGERDLKRLPKNFEKVLNKQAKKVQGNIIPRPLPSPPSPPRLPFRHRHLRIRPQAFRRQLSLTFVKKRI